MKRDRKLKTEWPKFWRLKFRGTLAKNTWLQLQVFSQEPQTGIYIYIYIFIVPIATAICFFSSEDAESLKPQSFPPLLQTHPHQALQLRGRLWTGRPRAWRKEAGKGPFHFWGLKNDSQAARSRIDVLFKKPWAPATNLA